MRANLIVVSLSCLVGLGCNNAIPDGGESTGGGGGSPTTGSTTSSNVSSVAGTGGGGQTCLTTADCTQAAPCLTTSCDFGTGSGLCKTAAAPQGSSCDSSPFTYPKHTCDGLGACKLASAGPNCIGASVEPTPVNGCDSGNPCVKGGLVNGQCSFQIAGVGTSCGADPGLMQCMTGGIDCCPIDATCTQEGVQAECASGSTCFEGRCWAGCATNADCADSKLGTTCGDKSVGLITIHTCM